LSANGRNNYGNPKPFGKDTVFIDKNIEDAWMCNVVFGKCPAGRLNLNLEMSIYSALSYSMIKWIS